MKIEQYLVAPTSYLPTPAAWSTPPKPRPVNAQANITSNCRLPDALLTALRKAGFLGLHLPANLTQGQLWSTSDPDSPRAQIHPIIGSEQ
ncbi:hypothetical protein ACIF70_33025 [Actinacidiphila glaucinigra]|uniref:hypothetical protein n=1 Tax=Actinacidiphila glaucinigra TaxID=235986 RepID=UPI002DDB60C4|nr:hypothetical protein [Actinacidiphila glaucinigra]WSD57735.1 hypothetical protein OIE69_01740 [Actinacidiphila glaucinigra]